ncbi:TetR-like C-terminal domain-containing protein [Oerskovia sp. NPDC056781]|uniref:TetR-like C-terminal domain-containing protein n=1 Tax=Oerskovia TaxID=162491 RepID=UPI00296B23DE|nr:TetR-like C-terminal domain-containing protein [Oerskovia rustica]
MTAETLLTDGVAGVTFDKIAAAAPASKATLYKWWPSPGALAAEAYFTHVEEELHFDDTGNIERDLRNQLHAHVSLLARPDVGPVIATLIGAAQDDPELAEAWSRNYSSIRRRTAVERLQRAKDQGQIHQDVDLQVVVDQLWGACYHRLLIPDEPLSIEFADSLIDNIGRGILV